MDGDRAVILDIVDEIADQALNVAVEDEPHEFGVFVDDGRAGVAADDVAGVDKIHGGGKFQAAFALQIALRQVKGRLAVEAVGAVVKAIEGGLGRRLGAVHGITFDGAVGKAQGERGVRVQRLSVDGEARLADLLPGRGFHALHVVVNPFACLPHYRIDLASHHDQRIG